jgi:hypothetical protein
VITASPPTIRNDRDLDALTHPQTANTEQTLIAPLKLHYKNISLVVYRQLITRSSSCFYIDNQPSNRITQCLVSLLACQLTILPGISLPSIRHRHLCSIPKQIREQHYHGEPGGRNRGLSFFTDPSPGPRVEPRVARFTHRLKIAVIIASAISALDNVVYQYGPTSTRAERIRLQKLGTDRPPCGSVIRMGPILPALRTLIALPLLQMFLAKPGTRTGNQVRAS